MGSRYLSYFIKITLSIRRSNEADTNKSLGPFQRCFLAELAIIILEAWPTFPNDPF